MPEFHDLDRRPALDASQFDLARFADGPLAQRGIGVVAPFDLALERELWRFVPTEVSLHHARTPHEPVPVSLEMAHLVSDHRHLASATRDVLQVEPEVVAYLCASGSFVGGVAAERCLRDVICEGGAPEAVTTSGALAEVLDRLAIRRIAVVTPYDADLTAKLHAYLAELGVQTIASDHLGLSGGIWKVGYRTVAERIVGADHPDAEAIFVSCTNLPTFDVIDPLEHSLGKPILTANQLTMWACLDRMGLPCVGPGSWHRAWATPRATRGCRTS